MVINIACFVSCLGVCMLNVYYSARWYNMVLGSFFSFLILYRVGETPCTGDQPVARTLPAHRTPQTQNKRRQISMSRVGFEPTTPVFERAKTVHASDSAATAIDI
jgi:hypothetical protein